jgi:hypothetical protein
MGASTFVMTSTGKTANAAFKNAVKQAEYDYGHAGYTGTIAEKTSFVMIETPKNIDTKDMNQVDTFISKLINESDERIDDKWGPAGCIQLDKETFIFFGWASD